MSTSPSFLDEPSEDEEVPIKKLVAAKLAEVHVNFAQHAGLWLVLPIRTSVFRYYCPCQWGDLYCIRSGCAVGHLIAFYMIGGCPCQCGENMIVLISIIIPISISITIVTILVFPSSFRQTFRASFVIVIVIMFPFSTTSLLKKNDLAILKLLFY